MKRNRSVSKILEAYDKQNSYTVVSFKDGNRVMTYGHLDPLAAIEYVQKQNLAGHECFVFRESELTAIESIKSPKLFFTEKLKQLKMRSQNES